MSAQKQKTTKDGKNNSKSNSSSRGNNDKITMTTT
jgi:hypothetical protein